jgi:hypothetical protein
MFFPHSQGEMLKTECFFKFSSSEGILKVSFCTAWANSKLRQWYFVQAKRSFFNHPGKKSLEIVLDQASPCPYGLEGFFFNSATSMGEVLPRLN